MPDKVAILLIDDDEVDRELVRKSLRALDLNITEVGTVAAAKEVLKKTIFGLILCDYKLPDGDGLTLIHDIRKLGIKTPIIVVTGFGNEDLVKATTDAGVLDYIPKNRITPEFLTRTILNDLLIYRTQLEKREMELKMAKQREENNSVLQEIIKLAKEKLADFDKEENQVKSINTD